MSIAEAADPYCTTPVADDAPSTDLQEVPWVVTSVEAFENYSLYVTFLDGTQGRVELRDLIFDERAGVFEALRPADVFAKVSATQGHVEWLIEPIELDLAPDTMYDELKRGPVYVIPSLSRRLADAA